MRSLPEIKEGDKVIVIDLPLSLKTMTKHIGKVGQVTIYISDSHMIGVDLNDSFGNWYFNRDNLELIRVKPKVLHHA